MAAQLVARGFEGAVAQRSYDAEFKTVFGGELKELGKSIGGWEALLKGIDGAPGDGPNFKHFWSEFKTKTHGMALVEPLLLDAAGTLLRLKAPLSAYDVQSAPPMPTKADLTEVLDGCAGLGFLFFRGQGTTKDVMRARELFELSCAGDASLGCVGLAEDGGSPVWWTPSERAPRLLDAAAQEFRAACDRGELLRCLDLLRMSTVASPLPDSLELAGKVCDGGGVVAGCAWLARFHQQTVESHADTIRYYFSACNGGHLESCGLLATSYWDQAPAAVPAVIVSSSPGLLGLPGGV